MSEQGDNPDLKTNNDDAGPKFAMQRIYVKDSSYESPKSPQCFRGQWKPKVNLEINSRHNEIEQELYEVVLHVTVTAKNDQDEVVYLAEVQQAGIFMIKGLAGDTLLQTLGAFCPNVLFPYAREAVDSLVLKGSFPALMLAPVNFDAIYEHSKKQRKESQH